jgi:hypothetical protein
MNLEKKGDAVLCHVANDEIPKALYLVSGGVTPARADFVRLS